MPRCQYPRCDGTASDEPVLVSCSCQKRYHNDCIISEAACERVASSGRGYRCPATSCGDTIVVKYPASVLVDHEMSTVVAAVRASKMFYVFVSGAAIVWSFLAAALLIVGSASHVFSASLIILITLIGLIARLGVRPQMFSKHVAVRGRTALFGLAQAAAWSSLGAQFIVVLAAHLSRPYFAWALLAIEGGHIYLSFYDYCYCRALAQITVSVASGPSSS